MKKGDKVRVISTQHGTYLYNRIGTVKCIFAVNSKEVVGVHFDKYVQYIYLYKDALKIEREENDIAKLDGFKKVAVIEQNTGYCKKNYYYALYDSEIRAGDNVLVSGKASGEIYLVKDVVSTDNITVPNTITAEVICKVDMSAYKDKVNKRKQAEEIRKKMIEKRKEIEARKDDEYYASLDPDYAAMLEEMKSLAV